MTQYDKALAMLKAQGEIIDQEKKVIRKSIKIINQTMIEIEDFNNRVTLPDGKEEVFISDFEANIKSAANQLKQLDALLQKD